MQPAGGIVVDDHTFMRTAMRDCLTQLGIEPIREASSLSDGRVLVQEGTPEIAVLDLRLDDGSSLELVASLAAAGARVMVLSSADDGYTVRSAYAAGALGYLMKSSPTETVMDGLREVLAGRTFADPAIAMLLDNADAADAPSDDEPLTDRETAMLQLVAQGLTNAEIGERTGTPALTVKSQLTRIGRKLGDTDREGMVAAAKASGLLD